MDPRLLDYYNRELQHLREVANEFATEFPKIAGRLGLSGFECADPYVERLLEGVAFLTARVQLKINDEFPTFTQHLLDRVYPHYLAPTPSMVIAQLKPDLTQGMLAEGYQLPRNTALRSIIGKGEQTACEYRTAHSVTLWPIELTEADYFSHTGPILKTDLALLQRSKAGIRLRLRTTAGMSFDQLAMDRLTLFLRGADELPYRLYERLSADPVGVLIQPTERPLPWIKVIEPPSLTPCGFADEEALLPYGPQSFSGYRLLEEYFTFPERFLFVEIGGLAPALRRATGTELDLMILFGQADPRLQGVVDATNFGLFCVPAINLFPKSCDRIHLTEAKHEHHLVPDRTRTLDFEVYQVNQVVGYGSALTESREFQPFYSAHDLTQGATAPAYYSLHRLPHRLSSRQRREGARSSYIGSEVFINLVDAAQAPYHSDLRQLAVSTHCTNRDLPLSMPLGLGQTDFTLDIGAPIESIRVIAGPTPPRPSRAHAETAWRLISHLSLNYLSLSDHPLKGAAALRELLTLYADAQDVSLHRQIEGIKQIATRPISRRLPGTIPTTYARGLEVYLTCDEMAFEGVGVFLLGAVLERFFARYVAINSFTEMVLATERGEIKRWPPSIGRRQILAI